MGTQIRRENDEYILIINDKVVGTFTSIIEASLEAEKEENL